MLPYGEALELLGKMGWRESRRTAEYTNVYPGIQTLIRHLKWASVAQFAAF